MQLYKLIVHGGTSTQLSDNEAQKYEFLHQAHKVGLELLSQGKTATESVVSAIRVLEDSGLFTAGAGSEPQLDGAIRFDASIMNSDGACGAVVGVQTPVNPIEGASIVKSLNHTTLIGSEADEILAYYNVNALNNIKPVVRKISDCIEEFQKDDANIFGTVGAVALDYNGLLAAGTSTGGYRTALPGRAGDSGAIGIGTYATPRCAVSCTGDGDRILAAGIGAALDAFLQAGLNPDKAMELTIERFDWASAQGGFIALLADGSGWVRKNVEVIRAVGYE